MIRPSSLKGATQACARKKNSWCKAVQHHVRNLDPGGRIGYVENHCHLSQHPTWTWHAHPFAAYPIIYPLHIPHHVTLLPFPASLPTNKVLTSSGGYWHLTGPGKSSGVRITKTFVTECTHLQWCASLGLGCEHASWRKDAMLKWKLEKNNCIVQSGKKWSEFGLLESSATESWHYGCWFLLLVLLNFHWNVLLTQAEVTEWQFHGLRVISRRLPMGKNGKSYMTYLGSLFNSIQWGFLLCKHANNKSVLTLYQFLQDLFLGK